MEADPDLKKEVHGLDIVGLRALERRMMQHNRWAMRHMAMLETHLICPLQDVGCCHSCEDRHKGSEGVG